MHYYKDTVKRDPVNIAAEQRLLQTHNCISGPLTLYIVYDPDLLFNLHHLNAKNEL